MDQALEKQMPPAALLRSMLDAALASAQPLHCVPPHLPRPEEVKGRLVVLGAGKAAAAMAQAVEAHWPGPLTGLVVTRYGYALPCQRIEVLQAAHPVPDAAGLAAAQRMLALAQSLTADDVALCLLSGGGSALLPLPLPGISLSDKQQLNQSLLASGASIGQMNIVRRHLSAIKGGRLAAACHPAQVISLLLSDVPGDHPADIASGPTVGDSSTCADALAVVQRCGLHLPPHVQAVLQSGAAESIKPQDVRLAGQRCHIVAAPQQALEAAAAVARKHGLAAHILSDAIEGEARDVGQVLAALALQVAERGQPFERPCVLLSGGETTVTLRPPAPEQPRLGLGGRNVECLLSFALATRGHPRIHALMADTDGVDGAAEIAGAVLAPSTLERALAKGINPLRSLDAHDGHGFFTALGDSVITGPTMTNVNDFRAVLVV